MSGIRARDLLVAVPLLLLSAGGFLTGFVVGGVILLLLAGLVLYLMTRASRLAGRTARDATQSPNDLRLRWQYPGNSGGGGVGGY